MVQPTIWLPSIPFPYPTATLLSVMGESSYTVTVAFSTLGLLVDRKATPILPPGSVTSYVDREQMAVAVSPAWLVTYTEK